MLFLEVVIRWGSLSENPVLEQTGPYFLQKGEEAHSFNPFAYALLNVLAEYS